MSHFYLDASAVVKRYSPETGTAWVKALADRSSGHAIVLGEITLAEVAAALRRQTSCTEWHYSQGTR